MDGVSAGVKTERSPATHGDDFENIGRVFSPLFTAPRGNGPMFC